MRFLFGNSHRSKTKHDDHLKELEAKISAVGRCQAVIEFKPDGTIITANRNFLMAMGYSEEEIVGRHHQIFVDLAYAKSDEYREFWRKLNRGEFLSDIFMRYGKGGIVKYIYATYFPLVDQDNRPFKVVKFATDVTVAETERRRLEAERAARAADQASIVETVAAGLGQLSNGDMTCRLNDAFPREYEKLRSDFNASVEKLQQTMSAIAANARAIRAGSDEISMAADDLSRRTEQQAASLEETAASLEEITVTVNKTAEGAKHARDVVSAAKADAEKSGGVVRNAIRAMSGIEQSSKQISQIIGVIDEIAFQTNLLALNAGVEAARAGDAGRGFAVVASEVRALAQRSAEAAKQIKGLISTSTSQVEQGVDLVEQTGKALERIVAQVSEINNVVSAIAASAQEQAIGLRQINTAIGQTDQVTQQNAVMVEETTASAHSLALETEELGRLLARFEIGDTATVAPMQHKPQKPPPRTRPPLKTVAAGAAVADLRKVVPLQQTWQGF